MRGSPLWSRQQPGGIFVMSDLGATTGDIWFVDSATGTDGAGNGRDPDKPVATLDYIIASATANKGDRIYVMPNHAETITGVGGLALDIAGIQIIGLGEFNQRPRLLMDGADTVTCAISAADVTVQNIVFASGTADTVAAIVVTAKGARLLDLEFEDNTTDEDWLTPIKATSTTDNNADGLTVARCRWGSLTASGLEFIEINANLDWLTVEDNLVIHEGTASPLVLWAGTKLSRFARIRRNDISHKDTDATNGLLSNGGSTNSGIVADNNCGHADVTTDHGALGITGLGFRLFNNRSVSTGSLSGFVLPAIDVDS